MRFISFAFFFVVATTTFAFDPRTHVWVAQEVLNDVIPDGKLTIDGKEYPVPSNIVDALRLHPDFYRMGNIGPDAHPDMIVGQSFIHPGTRGGWQTDDWAKWLQDQSRLDGSREAIAYSVGLWGHVSGDIIMHSYVNTYAGDYFLLFDEQEVELRHFALEHYIGDRTPQLKDHLGAAVGPYDKCLQTPSSFLASTLILNDTVANEYLRAPQLSLHLLALYRLHKSVHDIRVGIERLADPVDDQLTKLDSIREAADEALKKALEKLEVLIPTLAPLEKQVGALKAIIDEQRAINEPLEAAATQGEKAVLRALDALRNLEERISSLLKRLEQQIPREISAIERSVKEFEENIREWTDEASRQAGKIGDLNRFKDDLDREVSNLADELDGLLRHLPGYKKVKGRLNSARSKLESAKKELANAEENLRTSTDNVTHFVKKKEEQARQLASLVAEKTKVSEMLGNLRAQLDPAKDAVARARETFGELSERLRDARKALTDKLNPWELASSELEKLRQAIAQLEEQRKRLLAEIKSAGELIRRLTNLQDAFFLDDGFVALIRRWENDIVQATVEYIEASSKVLIATMTPNGDPIKPLREWFECWAPVLTGIPSAITLPACKGVAYFREAVERLKLLPEELASQIPVVRDLVALLNELETKLKDTLIDAGIDIADVIFGESTTKFYNRHGTHYTAEDLDKVFETDTSGKMLLKFDGFSAIIQSDLGMVPGDKFFNAVSFPPARHAVTLAKLALLDGAGVNRLADAYGVTERSTYANDDDVNGAERLLYPKEDRFVNILYRSVRSIDGNQQWRGYGLPYLRRNGNFENTEGNRFGYCRSEDPEFGFRLWVDQNYRTKAFGKLFPGELRLDSLAPGIGPFIPAGYPHDGGHSGDCAADASANGQLPRQVPDPPVRDPMARANLETSRRAEIGVVPPVTLLDRVDGQNRDQVLAALRSQIRAELEDEIRTAVLDELRQSQNWGKDYTDAFKEASNSSKGLLMVLEGEGDAGRFPFADLLKDELQAKLLSPFVLCRISFSTAEGKRLAKELCVRQFPTVVIINPSTNRILAKYDGQLSHSDWASILALFGRCWPQHK